MKLSPIVGNGALQLATLSSDSVCPDVHGLYCLQFFKSKSNDRVKGLTNTHSNATWTCVQIHWGNRLVQGSTSAVSPNKQKTNIFMKTQTHVLKTVRLTFKLWNMFKAISPSITMNDIVHVLVVIN